MRSGDADVDAAMSRLLIVTAVVIVERIIEVWRDAPFLKTYNDPNVSNRKKIAMLQDCLKGAGVETDRDVLEDYLAIKYLRNTVVHVGWNDIQRNYIQQRGFPTDLTLLDHRHWRRILVTVWHMLNYFSEAALRTGIPLDDDRLQEMVDLEIAAAHPEESHLLSLLLLGPELPKVWWRNLENLDYFIGRGLVGCADETSRIFDVALDSWRLYLNAALGDELELEAIEKSVETLEKLHTLGIRPRAPIGVDLEDLAQIPGDIRQVAKTAGLSSAEVNAIEHALVAIRGIAVSRGEARRSLKIWSAEIPVAVAADILPLFVRIPPEIPRSEIVDALRLGWRVYQSFVHRAPLDLFLDHLPRLDPKRYAECLEAGRVALAMFKLRTAWYAWVESVQDCWQEPPYEAWRHYEKLIRKLEAG